MFQAPADDDSALWLKGGREALLHGIGIRLVSWRTPEWMMEGPEHLSCSACHQECQLMPSPGELGHEGAFLSHTQVKLSGASKSSPLLSGTRLWFPVPPR